MKTKLIALLLVAGSSLFAGVHVSIGFGVGAPYGYYAPPPPVVAYAAPAYPAPGYGYSWINGGYSWYSGRYAWRPGYWGRPPYAGARWAAPRYYNHRYYGGYWRR